MKKSILTAFTLICSFALHIQAAPEKGSTAEKKKRPDWKCTPDETLPNVLILGDSISIGYTLQVRKLLEGQANVFRPVTPDGKRPVNCSGTTFGLNRCGDLLTKHEWDIIHFNWGLHDLKHVKKAGGHDKSNDPNGPVQCAPKDYETNLRKIVTELRQTGAKLIFATTTPVVPGTLNPLRTPEAPIEYNTIATKIMAENEIRVNDLHALSLPHLAEWQMPKNVHFKAAGSQALAEEVAKVISAELEKK